MPALISASMLEAAMRFAENCSFIESFLVGGSSLSDFDMIINISEDGWFGQSIEPKQHFDHSIFRAIESGKYVLRSSNNGIAGIINPIGTIEQKIDHGQSGYIDLEEVN